MLIIYQRKRPKQKWLQTLFWKKYINFLFSYIGLKRTDDTKLPIRDRQTVRWYQIGTAGSSHDTFSITMKWHFKWRHDGLKLKIFEFYLPRLVYRNIAKITENLKLNYFSEKNLQPMSIIWRLLWSSRASNILDLWEKNTKEYVKGLGSVMRSCLINLRWISYISQDSWLKRACWTGSFI